MQINDYNQMAGKIISNSKENLSIKICVVIKTAFIQKIKDKTYDFVRYVGVEDFTDADIVDIHCAL